MKADSLQEFDEARAGSRQALNELLFTWRVRFKAAASHQLKSVQARLDTSDVVQESLIQAWQGVEDFTPKSEGEFRSWIGKVARGRLANARRFHRAERRDVRADVGPKRLTGVAEDRSTTPPDREELDSLKNAMSGLDERLTLAIQKRYFENATFAEIAATLECSPAGARLLCQRAIGQLRKNMGSQLLESSD